MTAIFIISAIVLIVGAVLVIYFTLNYRIFVKYDTDSGELVAYSKILFYKSMLYPEDEEKENKKKRKKQKKLEKKRIRARDEFANAAKVADAASADRKKSERENSAADTHTRGTVSVSERARYFAEFLKLIAIKLRELIPGLLSALTVDIKRLDIVVGADDAASAAVGYGLVCGGVEALLALEEDCKKVKIGDDIHIGVDYTDPNIFADIEIVFNIRAYKALAAIYRAEDAYYTYRTGL